MEKNALVQEAVYLLEELGLEDKSGASKKKVNESRTGSGDAAQKVVAEWLKSLNMGLKISTNTPGSQSNDVTVKKGKITAHIEVKSSSNNLLVYGQELSSSPNIAAAVNWTTGSAGTDVSESRFESTGQTIKQINASINSALVDSEFWNIIAGGKTNSSVPNLTGARWRKQIEPEPSKDEQKAGIEFDAAEADKPPPGIEFDGTLISAVDKRNVMIVVAPNIQKFKDPVTGKDVIKKTKRSSKESRVLVFSEGSSKLRSALGGGQQVTLGSYALIGDDDLTTAWRDDYKNNDYFAIVTDQDIHLGYVTENKLKFKNIQQIKVENFPKETKDDYPDPNNPQLNRRPTKTYGSPNISGLREKIEIKVLNLTKQNQSSSSGSQQSKSNVPDGSDRDADQNAKKSSGRSKQVKEAIELLGILREEKGQ